ncbi:hypothetical protein [Domibacillus indicus]|uniref:hypothetical protein n=1 Tax=Domibacillus indicus TaxID=1437523 RepID=UPI000617C913|nr:hypothetical protein [Domibacillus indicus]
MSSKDVSKHSDYFNRSIFETGVAAGLLLLLFSWLAYTFNFINWNPISLLSTVSLSVMVKYGVAALLIVVISSVLSLLYYALLRKRKPLPSGIIITVLLFSIGFFSGDRTPLHLITVFALLLGYCLFISMTISWHHEQEK